MSFIKNHLPLFFFVSFVGLSCIVFGYFQDRAIKELKDRNEAILSHYEMVLLLDSSQRNNEVEVQLTPIIEEFNFTPSQSMTFQIFIKNLIDEIVNKAHVDLEVDSIVAAKSSAMYQETHDLLEMQFAKIQHEAESLQIWCGILTIVFLIFSFYSLFKTDELLQRAKESAKDMIEMKENGDFVVKDLKVKSRRSIEGFKIDAKNVLSEAKMNIDKQKDELERYLHMTLKDSESELIDVSMEYLKGLDTKYNDLSIALEAEWKHFMSQLKDAGTQDKNFNLIQDLFSRVEALESK